MQSRQLYEKRQLNNGTRSFGAIVTWSPSMLTRTRNSGVHWVRADKHNVDPEMIKEFSYFCHKVLGPGGYAVIPADFFINDIWISNLNRAGFSVLPFPYALLYSGRTVPKRHIPKIPTIFCTMRCLRRLLDHIKTVLYPVLSPDLQTFRVATLNVRQLFTM